VWPTDVAVAVVAIDVLPFVVLVAIIAVVRLLVVELVTNIFVESATLIDVYLLFNHR
jgi:hypothetical protein